MKVPHFTHLLLFAIIGFAHADEPVTSAPLAKKGILILSDDFAKVPTELKKSHDFAKGWKQRISYGDWTSIKGGGVRAVNVPEQGHGPVLTYLGSVDDIIIECEFRLPEKDTADRHFRIFLDHPDYRGHTIAAWANFSTTFQPLGLSLLHNPKTQDKKVLREIRFGPSEVDLKPGVWHKMRIELLGEHVCVTIGGISLSGKHPALATTKNKIGLNPGKAGGELRNFRVWEAIAYKD